MIPFAATLVLSACATAIPAPSGAPSPSASDTFGGLYDGPAFAPPGCVSVRERPFFDGSSTLEWRCQVGGATDTAAFTRMLRAAANAQGWRECTPGLLFVRSDIVMNITIDANPRPGLLNTAIPTLPRQREIAVLISQSKRSAPTC